jgi:hypothetical protein
VKKKFGQACVGQNFFEQACVGQNFFERTFVEQIIFGQACVGQNFFGQAFVGQKNRFLAQGSEDDAGRRSKVRIQRRKDNSPMSLRQPKISGQRHPDKGRRVSGAKSKSIPDSETFFGLLITLWTGIMILKLFSPQKIGVICLKILLFEKICIIDFKKTPIFCRKQVKMFASGVLKPRPVIL